MKKLLFVFCTLLLVFSCNTNSVQEPVDDFDGNNPQKEKSDDDFTSDGKSATCKIETTITEYNNEKATDYSSDEVGTDEDIYWELIDVKAKNTITLTYDDDTVIVDNPNKTDNTVTCDGAHVTVVLGKKSRINLSGSSSDGSIRIYPKNSDDQSKFILSMDDLTLSSKRGPVINSQIHKRVYMILSGNCSLEDAETYTDDVEGEDSKGTIFSEGNQIWSGDGVLQIKGNHKNAISSDGYFYQRPGPTIVVLDAASNAIKVNGDSDLDDDGDSYGVYISGGLIWAYVSSEGGKCISTEGNFKIKGGELLLNTVGNAVWDSDENDAKSPSCIKADSNIYIYDGQLQLKSSGKGGKGLKSDFDFYMYGGTLTASATGDKFVYGEEDADPKAMKIDGDIEIDGGYLNLCSLGKNDGAEAMESKSSIAINGGELYVYAYDDAINVSDAININGGRTFAYSENNDAIDSNGDISISGGVVYAFANSNEAAFDNDNPEENSSFVINGGSVVGISGTCYTPSASSKQNTAVIYGVSSNMDVMLSLLDSSNTPASSFSFASSLKNASVLISSSNLVQKQSYTLSRGGTLSSYTDSYYNWFDGGSYQGGTSLYSFTQSSTITTAGNKSQQGGDQRR